MASDHRPQQFTAISIQRVFTTKTSHQTKLSTSPKCVSSFLQLLLLHWPLRQLLVSILRLEQRWRQSPKSKSDHFFHWINGHAWPMGASAAPNILSNRASTAATVSGLMATATSLRLSVLTITFMNVTLLEAAATMVWVVIVALELLAADKASQVLTTGCWMHRERKQ